MIHSPWRIYFRIITVVQTVITFQLATIFTAVNKSIASHYAVVNTVRIYITFLQCNHTRGLDDKSAVTKRIFEWRRTTIRMRSQDSMKRAVGGT